MHQVGEQPRVHFLGIGADGTSRPPDQKRQTVTRVCERGDYFINLLGFRFNTNLSRIDSANYFSPKVSLVTVPRIVEN